MPKIILKGAGESLQLKWKPIKILTKNILFLYKNYDSFEDYFFQSFTKVWFNHRNILFCSWIQPTEALNIHVWAHSQWILIKSIGRPCFPLPPFSSFLCSSAPRCSLVTSLCVCVLMLDPGSIDESLEEPFSLPNPPFGSSKWVGLSRSSSLSAQ